MAITRSDRPALNDIRAARVHEAIHSKRMEGMHCGSGVRAVGTCRATDRRDASAPERGR